jgi:hypothetical protein
MSHSVARTAVDAKACCTHASDRIPAQFQGTLVPRARHKLIRYIPVGASSNELICAERPTISANTQLSAGAQVHPELQEESRTLRISPIE